MKKTLLQEVKAMNKIAGTQMTTEQEIAFIKNRLKEIEFDSQKELDAYKKAHNVRKGTELKVRSPLNPGKIGRSISKALHKGADAFYDGLGNVFFGNKAGKAVTKGLARAVNTIGSVVGMDADDKITDKDIEDVSKDYTKKKKK